MAPDKPNNPPTKPLQLYSHQAAMAQAPVPFTLFGTLVWIKPLTERDNIELDNLVRFEYMNKALPNLAHLSPEAKNTYANVAREKSVTLTHRFGDGHSLLFSTQLMYAMAIWYFTRKATPSLTTADVRALCFPRPSDLITAEHRVTYYNVYNAVFRAIPPPPQYALTPKKDKEDEKPTFLETLADEAVVRMYRSLATKYHYTPDQIADLTHYQQYFMVFSLPEEVKQQIEMERAFQQRRGNAGGGRISKHMTPPPPPTPSGTIQMSPDEFMAWQANQKGGGVSADTP